MEFNRPPRPQPQLYVVSRPRLFTQNHPLLLLTRTSSPRPQLPYLSQPSRPQALPRGPAFQRQIARLLTTENGSYVKSQMWMAIKWTAVGWSMLFMLAMAWYGWQQELVERDHPSPDEWSYFTRTAFRHAHSKLDPEFDGSGVIDWAAVGSEFRRCLERLEKLNGDGKGLVPVVEQDGESHTIMGVDTTAYDISSKSYPWRAGYFQVIMGCARAAEFLDDMVRDKTRKMVFPKEVVIGPSNPDARPVPPGAAAAPLEENCDRPYAPPDTFYLKVLTGAGFSTKQKVEAALAYANWLEFKGLHDTAEETYRWAIDIAAAAVPGGDSIIDKASGIISIGPKVSNTLFSTPSPNLLHAATALATHHARTGNVTSALPIYLSVLRARHAAPVDTEVIPQATREAFDAHAGTDYARAWALFRSIIRSAEYPKEPASGDDAFLRSSDTDRDCAEAELMLYIGEILFATSSPSSGEGLNWTKKAVSIAEPGVTNKDLTPDERNVCKSCLETGVANWSTMVNTLLKEEREKNANTILPAKGWSSWFGGSKDEKNTGGTRWEDEAKEVDELRLRLVNQGISDRMASSRAVPNSVWVG
ncbi:hypothetical protein BDV97DRAFT_304200 [Delphinella strobiligena]|nr:hypothetical protein BDV97DRAFT_304200 [Delphinella strobiligena]